MEIIIKNNTGEDIKINLHIEEGLFNKIDISGYQNVNNIRYIAPKPKQIPLDYEPDIRMMNGVRGCGCKLRYK